MLVAKAFKTHEKEEKKQVPVKRVVAQNPVKAVQAGQVSMALKPALKRRLTVVAAPQFRIKPRVGGNGDEV